MFMNCPKCGKTCPEGRDLCVACTPEPEDEKLLVTWECVVTGSDGDLVSCDAYPLDGSGEDAREFWEIEVPGHQWVEGHVFYVLQPREGEE